ILRFPGLLVSEVAAASYLNIAPGAFKHAAVQQLFSKALYKGPFCEEESPRWWRVELDALLTSAACSDGREFAAKKSGGKPPAPCQCSVDHSLRAGYYCMLTEKPVSLEKSKTVT